MLATGQSSVQEQRERIESSAAFIKGRFDTVPRVGIILGSGLGAFAHSLQDAVAMSYAEVPHFPVSGAPGHAGRLVLGLVGSQTVCVMQGRVHAYEGYSQQDVVYPVRVMRQLGVERLIVTCAAGGMNEGFAAGELMLIRDHINMTGSNPLIGPNDGELGPRFPVMYDAYRPELNALARQQAAQQGLSLREGVYVGVTGPAFCTRAELRFYRKIGGDAIGMSVVPEVIAATHMGMSVMGLAAITDLAWPDAPDHASEEQILSTSRGLEDTMAQFLTGVLASF
jgi:purine-nucleoside phosphorylase